MFKLNRLVSVVLSIVPISGFSLNLDEYLSQVENRNLGYKASEKATQGSSARAYEANLLFHPVVFAETGWLYDRLSNPFFPYRHFKQSNYSLGVRSQTPYGVNASLSYVISYNEYAGIRPAFWEARPKLEVSVSLLRNRFGSEIRSQSEITKAQAELTQYSESFKLKQIRNDAETAYLRLAAARSLIKVYEMNLERAQELLKWTERRTNLGLGIDSDLYQAQANLESARLNLQAASTQERVAARRFNQIRNVDSQEVSETVELPKVSVSASLLKPTEREDLRASIASQKIAEHQANLGVQRNLPTLEVFGALTLNARETDLKDSTANSFNTNLPTRLVGIRFQSPVEFWEATKIRNAYGQERVAAQLQIDQRRLDQQILWNDLNQRIKDAYTRYTLAEKLSEIQKKKLSVERNRLRRGLTTTYQTLLFEQDYNLSEVGRVQATSELLEIQSQLKTFGDSQI